MPGENAEGYQTWNPSVGIYHKPAAVKRESYGGIIGALQDQHVRSSGVTRSYPENFAGIIAAIQDLGEIQYKPGAEEGEKPPGGEIIIDPDTGFPIWIITEKPANGTLWFDTRQGRLFIWIEDDWYQTNGADGIPIITDNATPPGVEHIVPGQFWWDSGHNSLYIFDGTYELANGNITTDPELGGQPIWKLVSDGSDGGLLQTTATLPLSVVGPRVRALEDYTYLPDIDLSPSVDIDGDGNEIITLPMSVQKDYNEWIFEALVNLDQGLSEQKPVYIGVDPPENTLEDPLPAGTLWYDTAALELSIWYEDDDNAQWVPTSVAHTYDADLDVIRASVAAESTQRNREIHALNERLNNINIQDQVDIDGLEASLAELRSTVLDLNIPSIAGLANHTYVQQEIENLEFSANLLKDRVTALETDDSAIVALQAVVETKADKTALDAVEASIPDVSSFVTQADIDSSYADLTFDYLPRSGGELTGSFVFNKQIFDDPALDFSRDMVNSQQAFKFQSLGGSTPAYTTFGSTNNFWEYAWKFGAEEDFSWIYNDNTKVFSITKEGPACSSLILGDFQQNDANGRRVINKIDVRDRLTAYQNAFAQMKVKVQQATDFDSLKAGILTSLNGI